MYPHRLHQAAERPEASWTTPAPIFESMQARSSGSSAPPPRAWTAATSTRRRASRPSPAPTGAWSLRRTRAWPGAYNQNVLPGGPAPAGPAPGHEALRGGGIRQALFRPAPYPHRAQLPLHRPEPHHGQGPGGSGPCCWTATTGGELKKIFVIYTDMESALSSQAQVYPAFCPSTAPTSRAQRKRRKRRCGSPYLQPFGGQGAGGGGSPAICPAISTAPWWTASAVSRMPDDRDGRRHQERGEAAG